MYGREELAVYRILAQSADEYLYKSEADKVMDSMERRIQELEAENNSLKAYIEVLNDDRRIAKENAVMYHKAYLNELDENARLQAQVPVWHDFYRDPPRKYQKVLVYFLNHQGWSMQEASIQDDGWRPKFMCSELPQKWCEFPPPPTEESSTKKENG